MKNDPKNHLLEFACAVCRERTKRDYPNSIGCPFRCIDGEYCEEIEAALESGKEIIERHDRELEHWKWAAREARSYAASLERVIREGGHG